MSQQEGMALVQKAIRAGIFNDLGSGGNVDVCVITKDGGKIHRNIETPNPRKFKAQYPAFPIGITPVLKRDLWTLVKEDDDVEGMEEDDLDDFSSDYKLMKRLKKGKISQDEFDSAFDVDSIEQDT